MGMPTLLQISYADQQLSALLRLIQQRQQMNATEMRDAVSAGRWSQVSGIHGTGTGLIMAETAIRDQLRDLAQFSRAVAETQRLISIEEQQVAR